MAYIAGYFDGEGCITLTHCKSCLVVKIVSKDLETLRFIATHLGGKLSVETRRSVRTGEVRSYHRWAIHGTEAQSALRKIIPYMVAKKKRAEDACGLTFRLAGQRRQISVEELAKRFAFK